MTGFGRSGKMFGFQHYDVQPDIVTFAKGISGSWLPLSGVACSTPIQDFFRTNPLGYGATYQAHPVALACGYEVVKHIIKEDVLGHVQALEPVLTEEASKRKQQQPQQQLLIPFSSHPSHSITLPTRVSSHAFPYPCILPPQQKLLPCYG